MSHAFFNSLCNWTPQAGKRSPAITPTPFFLLVLNLLSNFGRALLTGHWLQLLPAGLPKTRVQLAFASWANWPVAFVLSANYRGSQAGSTAETDTALRWQGRLGAETQMQKDSSHSPVVVARPGPAAAHPDTATGGSLSWGCGRWAGHQERLGSSGISFPASS